MCEASVNLRSNKIRQTTDTMLQSQSGMDWLGNKVDLSMAHSISISHQVYNLLRERAEQSKTSPDSLAESVLRDYFNREEEQWREAFEALIAKVHARTAEFTAEEIEADITAAAIEVREQRRADQSSS